MEHFPTVSEISDDARMDPAEVRKVIRVLEDHGVIVVEEPGERISAAIQTGIASAATPNTILGLEVGPEQTRRPDKGDTKG